MKPRIIILSDDTDTEFQWLSDGWYDASKRHTDEAKALMAKADKAIQDGSDVIDVIDRLEKAGFEIVRD